LARGMIMKIQDISEKELNKELQVVQAQLEDCAKNLCQLIGYSSKPLKKTVPLFADLTYFWKYALGHEAELPDLDDRFNRILELFWKQSAKNEMVVEWQEWADTIIGCIMRTTLARRKLNSGANLSGPEVALLAGLTLDMINKLTKAGKITGVREESRRWTYPAEEVKRFLAER
jgi:hypothetical protein